MAPSGIGTFPQKKGLENYMSAHKNEKKAKLEVDHDISCCQDITDILSDMAVDEGYTFLHIYFIFPLYTYKVSKFNRISLSLFYEKVWI